MGYTRKARILFSGETSATAAQIAAAMANTLGHEWLEARAIGELSIQQQEAARAALKEIGISFTGSQAWASDDNPLHWADLLVLVDEVPNVPHPLPARLQYRHYPFPASATVSPVLRDAVRDKIQSIIGGMKMLHKSDANS